MNNEFDYVSNNDSNSQPKTRYVTYIPYGFTPETYEEKRKIRKIANIIGGALLIMTAVSDIIVIALRIVMSMFGYFGIKELAIISDPAFLQFMQSMISIIVFTIPYIFMFKIYGYRISSLIKFKKPKKKDILPYFLLGVGVCYFANFAVSFAGQFFEQAGFEYEVSHAQKPDNILGFMLTFIAYAVVPPLVEEFACRGLILGSLRKFGDGFAVVCSALVFGLMHGNFEQIPFAFIVGLVLGFITVKTKTIWIAVAVHAFNNAVSVLIDYFERLFNPDIVGVYSVILLTAFMLFTVLALFLLGGDKGVYKFKKAKNKSSLKQIYKWFFTAPTIIIFIIICILESLAFFK